MQTVTNMQAKTSETRLGNLLDFGQLFKALGNNYFAQNSHILCKGVKIFNFFIEIILGNFYRHMATFYWSHWPRPLPKRVYRGQVTKEGLSVLSALDAWRRPGIFLSTTKLRQCLM